MVEDARRALDVEREWRTPHVRARALRGSRGSSRTRPTRSPTSRPATPASRSRSPRPTSPRPSATSSTTRARSSAWRAARSRSAPTRSTTRCASRGASARRSSRGTTRCRSTARCAAPALAAGNAVILKPSELASITPLRLAELAEGAGVPRGMIQVATGHGETGAALVEHPGVDHVTFVGSAATGATVADGLRQAARAARARARRQVAERRLRRRRPRQGRPGDRQIAAPERRPELLRGLPRLLVEQPIYEETIARVATAFEAVHDRPRPRGSRPRPADLRAATATRAGRCSHAARERGATIVTGGEHTDGSFMQPTLVTDVQAGDGDLPGGGLRPRPRRDAVRGRAPRHRRSPTARRTASSPASGRTTSPAPTASRPASAPARSSSTATASAAASNCRLAAWVAPATAAARVSRRCSGTPRRRMSGSLCDLVDELADDLVALLQRLIRIPTVNPPGECYEDFVADFKRVLDDLGYATEVHYAPTELAPLGAGPAAAEPDRQARRRRPARPPQRPLRRRPGRQRLDPGPVRRRARRRQDLRPRRRRHEERARGADHRRRGAQTSRAEAQRPPERGPRRGDRRRPQRRHGLARRAGPARGRRRDHHRAVRSRRRRHRPQGRDLGRDHDLRQAGARLRAAARRQRRRGDGPLPRPHRRPTSGRSWKSASPTTASRPTTRARRCRSTRSAAATRRTSSPTAARSRSIAA